MKQYPLEALLKSILYSYVGSSANGIVDLLYGKKNVNEFLISKRLALTINQTRNVLYKLSDEGIVSFVRKKDRKKGGWYTYFWTLDVGKCLIKFRENILKNLKNLNEQKQNKRGSRFFKCSNCNIDYNEEHALNSNYTCLECGEVLVVKDIREEIVGLDREVIKLEATLAKTNSELSSILAEEHKVRIRKSNVVERKKKKEREIRRKLLSRSRKNIGKKTIKKKFKNRIKKKVRKR